MEAARAGHDTCLQLLLTFSPTSSRSSDYDPSTLLQNADLDGNTALHFASSNGHLLVLRTLLAAGADATMKNIWSWTPVAYSATVEAEIYFKRLIAEAEWRRTVRRETQERIVGASVRLVGEDGE